MISPSRILRRLRNLLATSERQLEVNEELRFHIEMETAKHQQAGMSEAEAHALALKSFGGVLQHREATRDSHGVRPVEDFVQDVRFALRSLRKQRVFTAVSVLTLAIGIGATTAIFGAVYSVLLAPFPYSNATRIVTLWETVRGASGERDEVAPGTFLDWSERTHSFAKLAAAEPFSLDYVGPNGSESFSNAVVTHDFFEILDAHPLLGRTFRDDEFIEGRNKVVLLSERVWRSRFGADTSIIGRTLLLDSLPLVVVGVMPAEVDLPRGEQLWTPKVFRPDERTNYTSEFLTVIARLKDGVTVEAAQIEMQGVATVLAQDRPNTRAKRDPSVVGLRDVLVGDTRQSLLLLMGAVGFVLLIACSNVANLQLAQAVRRRREMSIRAALGAGRSRLMRQLLAESVVLALTGGIAGVVVAHFGISAIRTMAPATLPHVELLRLNLPILGFALAVSIVTALVFGGMPIVDAGRLKLSEIIGASTGRAGTASRSRRRTQRLLVGGEIALAMVLLVGAGLLARSFGSLLRVNRGFETNGVTNVTLQAWGYYRTPEARATFVREAVDRLRAIPGVEDAGMSSSLPLAAPIGMERASMTIEGQPEMPTSERPTLNVVSASDGYFNTLKIAVKQGRVFAPTDNASSERVAIVNESFARKFWSDGSALGKRVAFGFMGRPESRTVVGIVADVRHEGLASEPEPMVFLPHSQASTGAMQFVIRSNQPTASVQRAVQRELADMNSAMPLTELTSLDERLSASLRERRFHLALLGAFSVTALFLAAIGIYGMMSHLTTERTQEIGVRLAIGAEPSNVVWMVMRQGAGLAAISTAVGVAGAVGATRLLHSMLFGVSTLDPITYVAAAVMLFAVAAVAVWLPARRASLLDPLATLRNN